jgi:hypothetical protein
MSDDRSKPVMYLTLSTTEAAGSECAGPVVNHNVRITESWASFNGRDAYLEVPALPGFQFGTQDFSVAVQIWTENELGGVIGDILSQFDPVHRRGFNLSVKHHAGAVTSQTNYRNLHFEVDDATDPQWFDYGRVGSAVAVWSMAVHAGELYAGTYEGGADEYGRVFRYAGDQRWECCGPLDGSSSVSGLAEFHGQLYAATKTEDPHGSLLDPTQNKRPGGNVYRLNEDDTWTHCGKVCDQDNLFGLTVFRGRLYAWPAYAKGIYQYESGTNWRRVGSPDSRLLALAPYHGDLYAAANRLALLDPNVTHAGPHGDPSVQPIVGKDGTFRMSDDGMWVGCGNQAEETQIYSIGIHAGQMYVGTWPSGKVFRYEGDTRWQDCGRLGNEDEIMGLAVYNGMLYAGSLPSASIFRYDGDHRWTCIGQVDHTPDVPLRRAVNMAVHQGRLCVGTLPSGRVWAMEVGQVASHDWSLPPGWHHIAAVRRQGSLHLYLDGQQIARSFSTPRLLSLNSDRPLHIGFGRHDYFNGRMRELRVYRRALSELEIADLSAKPSLARCEVHA